MNLIQIVCNEGATKILTCISALYDGDEFTKLELVAHKDNHLGSKAIHFASASGKREIIEMLIHDFGANVYDVTDGKQNVLHIAA